MTKADPAHRGEPRDRAPSKAMEMAQKVYEKMLSDAAEDGVWEGGLSALVEEVADRNRYSEIVGILKVSGAIEQMRRGAGPWPSVFRVHPGVTLRSIRMKKITGADMDVLRQQVGDIERSLGGLNVAKALADQQAEIDYLKKRLTEVLGASA